MSNAFDWRRYAIGGATRPDSFTGMKPEFNYALQRLFQAAPAELNLQVGSGYRSIQRQRELWEASDKSGRMVARPGGSRHNHGDAADLSAGGVRLDKANPAARKWVHDNAAAYGLTFPMSWEPWHIELIGARGGAPAGAVAAPAATGQPAPPSTIQSLLAPAANGAPVQLGDIVAPDLNPAGPMMPPRAALGDIVMAQMQTQRTKQAEAEERAAEEQRRAALFGDSLFGIYG